MRVSLRKAIICLALILICPVISYAWQEEILKGIYTYQTKALSIRFMWGENGVEDLRINGLSYPKAKYDNLGIFGNSALIEIRAEDTQAGLRIIRLLFFCNQRVPLVVSGYYADLRDIREDGSFTANSVKAIEMRYHPLP